MSNHPGPGVGALARQQALEAGFDPNSERGLSAIDIFRPTIQAERQTQQDVAALQPAESFINQRADITEGQLRSAGLLDLAQQFKSSRRQNAFDAARRGTLGGSRNLERTADIEGARDRGIVDIFQNSSQQAEQQRQAQLGQLNTFGGFLRQGDPTQDLRRDLFTQDLQAQGNTARGEFDLSQSFQNVEAGIQSNTARRTRDLFGIGAASIDAFGQQRAENISRGVR